jgi:PAB-dependent poly(A)-specific ribonuclease subunit 2
VVSYLNMVEIAPSGEALVMADSECNIHLWGTPSKTHFVEFAQPIEFADSQEEDEQKKEHQAPQVDWSPDT